MKMVDLVIFDCDGVLVDTEILAAEATVAALARLGVTMTVDDAAHELVGLVVDESRRKLEQIHGITLPPDFMDEVNHRLDEASRQKLRPIDGIVDVLDRLDRPYAVASNSMRDRLRLSFEVTGLAPYFAGRTFSAEDVARGKPAPDLYLHVASTMGVPPDRCLVIEDSVPGVTAAKAAGMEVVGFCGAAHIAPGQEDRLRAAGASGILHRHAAFFDLPQLKR